MSAKGVFILDTSVLCVWLKVPGMEICGSDHDQWDFNKVDAEIKAGMESGYTLVLPLATIIESGNHIAHSPGDRVPRARQLSAILAKAADRQSPWAAFTEQSPLWTAGNLKRLAAEWPPLAARKLGIGDATIKHVAEYYGDMGYHVRLLTGDTELAAYEPPAPKLIPRRRST